MISARYYIARVARRNLSPYMHGKTKHCPVCSRAFVSVGLDYKLYEIRGIARDWHPSLAVVCSSKCVDMWILQHV